ncbi:2-hydroxyacyl-CoA dehydratase family protein [Paradesulfitobacterium aromaticivorans]
MSKVQDLILRYRTRITQNSYKYLGWTCIYTPEEIISAAGMVPYNVTGDEKPTPLADQHLQVNVCGFARSCFERGLRGDHSFMEGIVMANTCDTFCKLYDVWRSNVQMPFFYQLNNPHITTPRAQKFFQTELSKLIAALEEKFGVVIDDAALSRAVKEHNSYRQLLQQLSALRKSKRPKIKGSEFLSLVLFSMTLPKKESISLLQEALELFATQEPSSNDNVRLLVTGAPLDDTRLYEFMEEMGVDIVYDDTCTGGRYFGDLIDENLSPLEALAKGYLEKVPCPCMHPDDRTDHIKKQIEDYRAEGVILYSLKFCDTHLHQIPGIQKDLTKDGVPTLFIESDHVSIGDGQLKTRIQAFIEAIKSRRY